MFFLLFGLLDRCLKYKTSDEKRNCYLLQHNFLYNRVPRDGKYPEVFKEFNEKLNDQLGTKYTIEEASNLLDQILVNEYDAYYNMMDYYYDGDQNSLNAMVVISLTLNILIIILLLILICRNPKVKVN